MRFFAGLLFFLSFNINSKAEFEPCSTKSAKAISERLLKKITSILGRDPSGEFSGYPRRLKNSLQSMTDTEFKDIFDPAREGLSRQDTDTLYWLSLSGRIKLKPEIHSLLEDIYLFNEEYGPVLWDSRDRNQAIQFLTQSEKDQRFIEDSPEEGFAIDRALSRTSIAFMKRAVEEAGRKTKYPNSKWYDRFSRFLLSYAPAVEATTKFNGTLRRQLQLIFKMDEPISDALAKTDTEGGLKLSDQERSHLQTLINDTQGQLDVINQSLENAYGRHINGRSPVEPQEIKIRNVANRARAQDAEGLFKETKRLAENDMDVLQSTIEGARERQGLEPQRPIEELHDVELQIRHSQHKRETGELHSQYKGITKEKVPETPYRVSYEWTVTVHHRKTEIVPVTRYHTVNGKTQSYIAMETRTRTWTSSYTRSSSYNFKLSHEEILAGGASPQESELPSLPWAEPRGAHAVSADNGSPRITGHDREKVASYVVDAKSMRSHEVPARQAIENSVDNLKALEKDGYRKLLMEPEKIDQNIKEIDDLYEQAYTQYEKLKEYRQMTPENIKKQWPKDNVENFQKRNELMEVRLVHLLKRLHYVREQLARRTPSLEIEYWQSDFTIPQGELERIANRNLMIKILFGLAAGGSGGGYAMYKDEFDEEIEELLEKSKRLVVE